MWASIPYLIQLEFKIEKIIIYIFLKKKIKKPSLKYFKQVHYLNVRLTKNLIIYFL